MLTTAPKVALHQGDMLDRLVAHGGGRITFRAQKTTPETKQHVAKCNRRTPTPIQAVLPDVPPRWLLWDQLVLGLRERFGPAWVLKYTHWMRYGECGGRSPRDSFKARRWTVPRGLSIVCS